MRKLKIYLAAPLFNEREKSFNSSLANLLSVSFDVFLPQRDGLLLADLIAEGVDIELAEQLVFNADTQAMNESDILIAVLDGASIDEGVAFELGFSFANGKLCVGLQTDIRRQLPTGNNPMIGKSCKRIFHNVDDLIGWLSTATSLKISTRTGTTDSDIPNTLN
jgi:nucleoside 2-deoxyribosyltransferase